jgi:hypothetical protein
LNCCIVGNCINGLIDIPVFGKLLLIERKQVNIFVPKEMGATVEFLKVLHP